jgi:hypothetical protein
MHDRRPAPSQVGAVPNPEQIASEAKRNFQGPSRGFIQSLIVYLVLAIFLVLVLFYVSWRVQG